MNNNGSVYMDFEVKRMENEDLYIFTEVKFQFYLVQTQGSDEQFEIMANVH